MYQINNYDLGVEMDHKYELHGTNLFSVLQNSTTSNYIGLSPTFETINYFIRYILILFDPSFLSQNNQQFVS
jgi:hypothetical protein